MESFKSLVYSKETSMLNDLKKFTALHVRIITTNNLRSAVRHTCPSTSNFVGGHMKNFFPILALDMINYSPLVQFRVNLQLFLETALFFFFFIKQLTIIFSLPLFNVV